MLHGSPEPVRQTAARALSDSSVLIRLVLDHHGSMPGPVFGIIVDRLATDVPVTGDADIEDLVQITELGQSRYRDTGLKGGFDLWERLVRRAEGLTTDPQLHQRLAEVRSQVETAIHNAYTDLYLSPENRV